MTDIIFPKRSLADQLSPEVPASFLTMLWWYHSPHERVMTKRRLVPGTGTASSFTKTLPQRRIQGAGGAATQPTPPTCGPRATLTRYSGRLAAYPSARCTCDAGMPDMAGGATFSEPSCSYHVGMRSRTTQHKVRAIQLLREGVIGKVHMAKGQRLKRRPSIGRQPDGPVPPGVRHAPCRAVVVTLLVRVHADVVAVELVRRLLRAGVTMAGSQLAQRSMPLSYRSVLVANLPATGAFRRSPEVTHLGFAKMTQVQHSRLAKGRWESFRLYFRNGWSVRKLLCGYAQSSVGRGMRRVNAIRSPFSLRRTSVMSDGSN